MLAEVNLRYENVMLYYYYVCILLKQLPGHCLILFQSTAELSSILHSA